MVTAIAVDARAGEILIGGLAPWGIAALALFVRQHGRVLATL